MSDFFDLTCGTCIFFRKGDGDNGACWRNPPVPLPMITEAPLAIQVDQKRPQNVVVAPIRPPVAADTLACGEHDDGADDATMPVGGTD